jgi:hypothetical protein
MKLPEWTAKIVTLIAGRLRATRKIRTSDQIVSGDCIWQFALGVAGKERFRGPW